MTIKRFMVMSNTNLYSILPTSTRSQKSQVTYLHSKTQTITMSSTSAFRSSNCIGDFATLNYIKNETKTADQKILLRISKSGLFLVDYISSARVQLLYALKQNWVFGIITPTIESIIGIYNSSNFVKTFVKSAVIFKKSSYDNSI